jgi:hypothetical protein
VVAGLRLPVVLVLRLAQEARAVVLVLARPAPGPGRVPLWRGLRLRS